MADRYVQRLKELEATGLKTQEQQRQYHGTLALLCQVVPELSGSIDVQTGRIEGGTTVNSIAQEASLLYEFRSTSQKCLEEMEADFRKTREKCRRVTAETVKREKLWLRLMGFVLKAVAPLM